MNNIILLSKIDELIQTVSNLGGVTNLSDLEVQSDTPTTNQITHDFPDSSGLFLGAGIAQTIANAGQGSTGNTAYFDLYLDDNINYKRIHCVKCSSASGNDGSGASSSFNTILKFNNRLKVVFNGNYMSNSSSWTYYLAYKLNS